MRALPAPLFGLTLLLACQQVAADTLLIERVQASAANAPQRGQSSAQVLAQLGEPNERLQPRGGQKQQWPTINRWVYPGFTVYFEHDRVINTVVNRASNSETGPKPAIR